MRPPAFTVQSVKFDRLCNAAQCTKVHVRTAFCVGHGISSGTIKIALEHGIMQVEEHTWRQRHLLPVGMHYSLQPRVPQRRRRKRLVRIVVACAQSSIAEFETLKPAGSPPRQPPYLTSLQTCLNKNEHQHARTCCDGRVPSRKTVRHQQPLPKFNGAAKAVQIERHHLAHRAQRGQLLAALPVYQGP